MKEIFESAAFINNLVFVLALLIIILSINEKLKKHGLSWAKAYKLISVKKVLVIIGISLLMSSVIIFSILKIIK